MHWDIPARFYSYIKNPIVTKKDFLELLDRYLAGNTSEAENDLLFRVYKDMEERSDLKIEDSSVLDELEERLVGRFKTAIQQQPDLRPNRLDGQTASFYQRYHTVFNIAASVILFTGIAIFLYMHNRQSTILTKLFQEQHSTDLITFNNNTSHTTKLIFPDRSYIDLQAGGRIVYEKNFTGHQRKVYLNGIGFFQVTKDHNKPFIVYTDRLVTKVLGTSFTIDSHGTDGPASVTVVTGKVAVFHRDEFKAENLSADLTGGILLTPNHVAVLSPANKFIKKLADRPVVISEKADISFAFDNTPVSEVFDRLEQAYSIHVVYDEARLRNCAISVDMGHEDFYHKLDVICRTLNLTYISADGNVNISGNGCAD